jgi:solute carrier family 25 carnitine/acylcarnitine transporter 20/29
MSADFWAGYISGAVGILIGNPLDLIKVRLQASSSAPSLTSTHVSSMSPLLHSSPTSSPPKTPYFPTIKSYITGTAAPILGYGALNALLFITYNRTEHLLNTHFPSTPSPHPTASTPPAPGSNLYTTFLAGCIGGLATFVVSTPTELVKCRAQVLATPRSSLSIARDVVRTEGLRGLYFGGGVTALRDSVGYGFYFWSYELSRRWLSAPGWKMESGGMVDALLCGGLAGVVTWASIFPLDVVKTRVQTQKGEGRRFGAWEVGRRAYREEGWRVFFRGLGVCSVRAFVVNAVQWAVYEWIMTELGQGRGMGGKEKTGGQMGGEVVI